MQEFPVGQGKEEKATLTGAEERDYQLDLVAEMLDSPHQNTVVHGEVGMGKTELGLMEIAAQQNFRDEDYSAMIVVPNSRLSDQWVERIREYDLDDALDVRTNDTVAESSLAAGKDVPKETRERMREEFEREKRRNIENSDVFITTPQLLSSDIRNERIQDLNLDFDEVIVDEADSIVAEVMPTDDEDEYAPGYRLNKHFQDFLDGMFDGRIIGLTALPGRKLEAMQDVIDADVVSPDPDEMNEYTPDVNTINLEFEDETLEGLSTGLGVRYSNAVKTFKGAMEEVYDTPNVDPGLAYRFVNDEDVGQEARLVMKRQNEIASLAESVVYPEAEEGFVKTPKGEYLSDMAVNLPSVDDQFLVFARQRDTAGNIETLMEQSGANVATVKGDNKNSVNQDNIEAYTEGDLDGLVMTYGAGGEGLDFGMTDHVIHMSGYLPGSHRASATGRGKRDGGVKEHLLGYEFEPDLGELQYEARGRTPDPSQISRGRAEGVIEEREESERTEIGWSDFT